MRERAHRGGALPPNSSVGNRVARSAGPIQLSAGLRATLGAARGKLGLASAAEVGLVGVLDLEAHLGATLPDDLLALFAAMGRSLGDIATLTSRLASFYEANETRAWRRRLRFDHVAFDDTYAPDEGFLCASLGGARPTLVVHWMLRKGEPWAPTFLVDGEEPMVSYCRWRYALGPIDPARALDDFAPELVSPSAPQARRVTHAKFGDGLVLRAIAPDKLEIDFGPHGVRKLLASAVKDL